MLKFTRLKFDSLTGQTVVRHTLEKSPQNPEEFYFEASRSGVRAHGDIVFEAHVDLDAYARALSASWKDHRGLVPRITSTGSGH